MIGRVAASLLFLAFAGTVGSAAQPLPSAAEAPFQFALAKLLSGEGSAQAARDAFERAVELAPEDPYLRVEYGDFLVRAASSQRNPATRRRLLDLAAEQLDRAQTSAPGSVDILRVVGQLYMTVADLEPGGLEKARQALEEVRRQTPYDLQSMVNLGRIYLSRGRPDLAADVFGEAVRHTPNNRILYSFLIDALLAAGREPEAEQALTAILQLDPDDAEARGRLAELQSRRGDHEAALVTLQGAPEGAPDGGMRLDLAWELFYNRRYSEALAEVDALLGETPQSLSARYLRARIWSAQGREEEAIEELEALVREAPEDLELAVHLAQLLASAGRERESADLFAAVIERLEAVGDGERMRAAERLRLGLAGLHFDAGEVERALDSLAPLLSSSDPELRETAAIFSAEGLQQLDRFDDALALLAEHGDGPRLIGKRTELLLAAGDERQARKLLRTLARGQEPERALAAVGAYQAAGRFEETIPVLEELLDRHAASVRALFLLGAAHERSGDTGKAATVFRRLLEVDPDYAPALNYLGYMWAEQGQNLDEALGLVRRAVEIEPDNGAYIDSLGWAHFQLGEYAEARDHLERAAELVPEDPVIFEHLGDLYAALGDPQKAAEFYRRALALDEENAPQVRRKLAELPVDPAD